MTWDRARWSAPCTASRGGDAPDSGSGSGRGTSIRAWTATLRILGFWRSVFSFSCQCCAPFFVLSILRAFQGGVKRIAWVCGRGCQQAVAKRDRGCLAEWKEEVVSLSLLLSLARSLALPPSLSFSLSLARSPSLLLFLALVLALSLARLLAVSPSLPLALSLTNWRMLSTCVSPPHTLIPYPVLSGFQTLNPEPCTLHPEPCTLNPEP